MFKKIKEKYNQNEYVNLTKKLWANKRYRAGLILILYFIFFTFIITGLRKSYQNTDVPVNKEPFSFEQIKKEYNFLRDYSYEILKNEESIIVGDMNNGINNFSYNDEKYTVINDSLYKEVEGNLEKIELLEQDKMISLIDKLMLENLINYISKLENKKETVNNGSYALEFEIPNTYFEIEEEGFVNLNISGKSLTIIDEIIISLAEENEEVYTIKLRISDNDVRSVE